MAYFYTPYHGFLRGGKLTHKLKPRPQPKTKREHLLRMHNGNRKKITLPTLKFMDE